MASFVATFFGTSKPSDASPQAATRPTKATPLGSISPQPASPLKIVDVP